MVHSPRRDEMSWRPWVLIREGVRSATSGGYRSLLVVAVMFLFILGPAIADGAEVASLIHDEADLALRGGFVLRILPSALQSVNIRAGACEQLKRQPTIETSGAILRSELVSVEQFPGTRIRVMDVTSGFLLATGFQTANRSPTVLIDPHLQDEFGIGIGSQLTLQPADEPSRTITVDGLIDSANIVPEVARAVVEVRAAIGPSTECYVRSMPGSYRWIRRGGAIGMTDAGAGVPTVFEVVPRGEGRSLSERYAMRLSRHLWLAAAIIIPLIAGFLRRTRQQELALYRALGTSRSELTVLLFVELLVLETLSAFLSAGVAVTWASLTDLPHDALATSTSAAARVVLLSLTIGLLTIPASIGSTSLQDDLKDR